MSTGPLSLFSAIGRILHKKQDDSYGKSKTSRHIHQVNSLFVEKIRRDVLGRLPVEVTVFLQHLQANAPKFFQDLTSFAKCSTYMSDAEIFLRWRPNQNTMTTLFAYAADIATLGYQTSNKCPVKLGFSQMESNPDFDPSCRRVSASMTKIVNEKNVSSCENMAILLSRKSVLV